MAAKVKAVSPAVLIKVSDWTESVQLVLEFSVVGSDSKQECSNIIHYFVILARENAAQVSFNTCSEGGGA